MVTEKDTADTIELLKECGSGVEMAGKSLDEVLDVVKNQELKKMLEESNKAIMREIKEEIGYENIHFEFLGISEELVKAKGYNNHQLNIIYKGIYKEKIKENVFSGLEGDWCLYEWINISDIDKYNIFPTNIKNMLKNLNRNYHIVENLLERKN